MEKDKRHGVIDEFTVFYCLISVFIAMVIMAACDVVYISMWQGALILCAPFLLDIVLTFVVSVYTLLNKIYIVVKKRIHEKKNPPEKF